MSEIELNKYKQLLQRFYHEACVSMQISRDNVSMELERNGERFESAMNATELELDENSLQTPTMKFRHHINTEWLIDRVKNNDIYDLRYLMYHDARTQYQYIQMHIYHETGSCRESRDTINSWIENQQNYHRNNGDDSNTDYHLQPLEIDADAFAFALMQLKGITTMRIYPGAEQAILRRMIEIFKNQWGLDATLDEDSESNVQQ